MKKNDGGQAFPRGGYFGTHRDGSAEGECSAEGMSLRDWFAGQAMQAWIAAGAVGHVTGDEALGGLGQSNEAAERFVASASYRFADAMLAERQKGGGE